MRRKLEALLLRLFKFGCIGVAGLFVDIGVLYAGTHLLGLGPYAARVPSFLAAATATWIGNRLFTFADRPRRAVSGQWLMFLGLSAIGFAINYAVYATLVARVPLANDQLYWGVAAGSLSGMAFNFIASSRYVFPRG